MNDVLLNKKASIERCIQRIRTKWQQPRLLPLRDDFDTQDIVVLNLLRACEQAIDMANHVIRSRQLGLPQNSKESFQLLQDAGVLTPELSERMQLMVGFRNIGVHDDQKLDPDRLAQIINNHLDDFVAYTNLLLKQS